MKNVLFPIIMIMMTTFIYLYYTIWILLVITHVSFKPLIPNKDLDYFFPLHRSNIITLPSVLLFIIAIIASSMLAYGQIFLKTKKQIKAH